VPTTHAISSLFVPAFDGLTLHALDAGPRDAPWLPVLCLPGLARTAEDFRELMQALASHAEMPRRVIALDSRGRGLSEWDSNPANYSVAVELADVLQLLEAAKIDRAVFIGTSRGGILTMAMAAARPQAIAGAVLNDIGPVLERAGLQRIRSYVGKLPRARSYQEAAELLLPVMGQQFPAFTRDDWLRYARLTFREASDGTLALRYDPALSTAVASVDPGTPIPDMWAHFDALPAVPLMLIRGEHSDLLSRETVAAMRGRRPAIEFLEVSGQGHAPVLWRDEVIGPVVRFVAGCDAAASATA
jgi:pimeloyl-ACP methyl ester carboxylesterase